MFSSRRCKIDILSDVLNALKEEKKSYVQNKSGLPTEGFNKYLKDVVSLGLAKVNSDGNVERTEKGKEFERYAKEIRELLKY